MFFHAFEDSELVRLRLFEVADNSGGWERFGQDLLTVFDRNEVNVDEARQAFERASRAEAADEVGDLTLLKLVCEVSVVGLASQHADWNARDFAETLAAHLCYLNHDPLLAIYAYLLEGHFFDCLAGVVKYMLDFHV